MEELVRPLREAYAAMQAALNKLAQDIAKYPGGAYTMNPINQSKALIEAMKPLAEELREWDLHRARTAKLGLDPLKENYLGSPTPAAPRKPEKKGKGERKSPLPRRVGDEEEVPEPKGEPEMPSDPTNVSAWMALPSSALVEAAKTEGLPTQPALKKLALAGQLAQHFTWEEEEALSEEAPILPPVPDELPDGVSDPSLAWQWDKALTRYELLEWVDRLGLSMGGVKSPTTKLDIAQVLAESFIDAEKD